jgi:hypothetical protein
MEYKLCTKCKKEKPTTEYFNRSDSKGLRSWCKECSGNYKKVICTVCGVVHSRYSTGRKSDVCKECYPKYRQAYNLYYAAKQRAEKNKIPFNLTLKWVLDRLSFCPKTGLPFTYRENGNNYSNRKATTPSIDKIDPFLGYTMDNCQVVCWWFNVSKQQFTDTEVIDLCKRVCSISEMNSVLNVQVEEKIIVKTI